MSEIPHWQRHFPFEPRDLVEILRWRAEAQSGQMAFTWLAEGDTQSDNLTWGELDARARMVATLLQQQGAVGQPVLLVYPPGPGFQVAFLGCLYAGAIAVPIYPPDPKRLGRTLPRFIAIAVDCGANFVLTTRALLSMSEALFEHAPRLRSLGWLASDDLPVALARSWIPQPIAPEQMAFLQYTSGSTGIPKGVMVSHRALLLNCDILTRIFGDIWDSPTVTWLPNYHDMGLVEGLLRPLYAGCHCVGMPPVAFLKRPLRWLEAITRHHAVLSGGPNFAFELCTRRAETEPIDHLDLSSWRTAYNGAEPVRAHTLDTFTSVFERVGFRPQTHAPGYGLAEATLIVCCKTPDTMPAYHRIQSSVLQSEHTVVQVPEGEPDSQILVGVGPIALERGLIVDSQTFEPLPPDRVGELWLKSPSLASGYWKREEATQETFGARLAGTDEGPFLRTGDLAFIREDGELFITGRMKDLIIIRGKNHYPQDIETTVADSYPALFRPGCNAAFSVEVEGEERLVVVQEFQRRVAKDDAKWENRRLPNPEVEAFAPRLEESPDIQEALRKIRESVIERHEVEVWAVALIKPGSIFKTSSGKIQRQACKKAFAKGDLEIITLWRAPLASPPPQAPAQETVTHSVHEIRDWLRAALASRVHQHPSSIQDHVPFARYGLDSANAVSIVGELERWLGRTLAAGLLYDHPTLDRAARFLAGEASPELPAPAPAVSAEPVAIIGLGCRFPEATDPRAFWELLCQGRNVSREISADRWDIDAFYDPDPKAPGKMVTRKAALLDRVDLFDPAAFGISAREAARMDPQQRLALEVTHEALEDAGLPPNSLEGRRVGVFMGVANSDWSRMIFRNPEHIDPWCGTGSACSIVANRLSYVLDWRGPSLAVDTACSSSLVAVHLAAQALRGGECELAVAGGVNVILSPEVSINFSKAGVMAPDGRCKSFDARADGYARGEGAGVVILKLLSRAIADGDAIYAVIHGSAVNSDGRTNGLMAPNGLAQEDAIRCALAQAGVSPDKVEYVETHGTGTLLGDPIEIGALGAVFGPGRSMDRPLLLGAAKTSISHLEAAAGVAGLIKTALVLHHREIPPNADFQSPNPRIPFDTLPLRVASEKQAWPGTGERESFAGVSSFGFGGTNSHLIVAPAPATEPPPQESARAELLLLSARTPGSLRELALRYADLPDGSSLRALCATAALRRDHHAHRLALVVHSIEELREQARAFAAESPARASTDALSSEKRKVVFVFPGQGSQWWAMGRELMASEPLFRANLEAWDALLCPLAGWSLIEELGREESTSRVHETFLTQPALVALQVALARLLESLGLRPDAVVGHSMGEVAAACVAGKLSDRDAARVIFARGQAMQSIAGGGAMAAVELPLDAMERQILPFAGRLSVAANNGPSACTVAGEPAAIEDLVTSLSERGIFCRKLMVTLAGHSPLMDPILEPFARAIGELSMAPARIPIFSTLLGRRADELAFDAAYWARNVREPVRFHDCVRALSEGGHRIFVEISPHPTLITSIRQSSQALGTELLVVSPLKRKEPDRECLLGALGTLHTLGVPLDFRAIFPGNLQAVHLPATPWDRQAHWFVPPQEPARSRPHPLLDRSTRSPARRDSQDWEVELQGDEPAWLGHHRVGGHVVFPATGYLEMARAASALSSNGESIDLVETRFERALVLAESTPRRVHLTLDRDPSTRSASFEVHSQAGDDGPWTLHVCGRIERASNAGASWVEEPIAAIQARCVPLGAREHYAAFGARAIQYGPAFQGVQDVWRRDGEALGRVILPSEAGSDQARHHLHPALLDACLQLIGDALPTRGPDRELTFMPVGLERLRLLGPAKGIAWSHAVLRPSKEGYLADVRVLDQAGQLVVEVLGFAVGRLDRASGAAHTRDWFFDLSWTPLAQNSPETQLEGSLLAVAEGSPSSLALTEALGATGCWTLSPDRAALDAMVCEMASFPEPRRVIFIAGASTLDPERDTPAAIEAEVLRLCGGLLSLCQAIVFRDLRAQLTVLTQGAQAVRSHERPDLVQAPLWGMGRCLAHELPELFRGLVDIEGERDLAPARAEILRPLHEDQLAFRDGYALGARLMPRAAPFQERALRCDPEATYLITGGRGALGTRLARWLAARGARHLLLTGRAPCPDPKRWPTLAQEGDERARTWMELENSWVKVHLLQADVADEGAMKHALEGLPPLRGVIHAAGVVHPSSFAEAGLELLAEELHPKIAGTLAVHGLARGRDLDFLVCFASAAGLWGSKFLVPYGAANHFQDAFAAWRRSRGETALSVDWAMWGDAGMATGDANERLLRGMGLEPMSSEQALGALEALIEEGGSHSVVASVDWSLFKPLFEQQPHRSLLRAIRPSEPEAPVLAAGGSDVLTQLQATERFEGRLALVEEHLLRLLGGVLGVPEARLRREASLLAQGLDSMTAAELRNRIQITLGLPVNVLALLKGDSLVAVAAGLLKDIEARGLGKGASAPTAVYPADEERLDPEIRPDPDRKASFDPQAPALLTGVTGFLGAFTLAELLRQGPAPVRCLVRAASQEEATRRVREVMEAAEIWEPAWEDRVIAIAADLSKPRFGLDRARFEALAEEVGRVFHVGYLVNFLFSYEDMRATNIVGSNEILRLACTGAPKPVHFVSSFSVFLTREHTGKPIHEDSPLYPGPGGYRESKRACENLAREARARGLPVSIYRPPFISWYPRTGIYNERDFLIRLIEGCMALGAAPDVELVFHLADVGYTSRALVTIARDPEGLGGSYNLVPDPAGTSWRGLVALANEAGWPMELLPFARWRERLAEAGPGNPLYVFLPVLGEEITAGGSTVFELFHRDFLPSRVDASNTTRHLPGDPGSPRPDAAQMRVFLSRLLARRG